jgi:hypothetical protein
MDAWEFFKRAGTLVGLGSATVAAAYFFFDQRQRLSTLEAQMQSLTISSTIERAPMSSKSQTSTDGTQDVNKSPSVATVNINPVVQTCLDLAKQMAEKNKNSYVSTNDPYATVMDRLDCKSVVNPK